MGNRVENYLTDLAYALDYAYNAKAENPTNLTVNIGQTRRLNDATGNVNIGGAQCVIACAGQTTHENDLITCVLTLRNVANLNTSTSTIAACDVVSGHSAYNTSGQLITGSIVPKTIDNITMIPNGATAATDKSCSNISDQFPQVTIPKGCYNSELNVGFDLTAYDPIQTYGVGAGQACTSGSCPSIEVTHKCGGTSVVTPQGYYSSTRCISILGAENRGNRYAYKENTATSGTCPNKTTAKGCAILKGTGVGSTGTNDAAGYYGVHRYDNACIMLPEGYYAQDTAICFGGPTLYTNTAVTVTEQGTIVSLPAGYYSSDHSVTSSIAAPENLCGSVASVTSNSLTYLTVVPCAGYWNGNQAAATGKRYYTTSSTGTVTLSCSNSKLTVKPSVGYWDGNSTVTTTTAYYTSTGATLTSASASVTCSFPIGYYSKDHSVAYTYVAGGSCNVKPTGTTKGYVCLCKAGYFTTQKIEYDTSNLSSTVDVNCVVYNCKYTDATGCLCTGALQEISYDCLMPRQISTTMSQNDYVYISMYPSMPNYFCCGFFKPRLQAPNAIGEQFLCPRSYYIAKGLNSTWVACDGPGTCVSNSYFAQQLCISSPYCALYIYNASGAGTFSGLCFYGVRQGSNYYGRVMNPGSNSTEWNKLCSVLNSDSGIILFKACINSYGCIAIRAANMRSSTHYSYDLSVGCSEMRCSYVAHYVCFPIAASKCIWYERLCCYKYDISF